ncbi:hypothetical protein PHLCEN_2v12527 [Hermanssonia centrifuga]|uniref:Ubiquitin-like domain-containing protein n=1 Tax=Hermanssonia centrifuga TaxID=98765 RepID=A0A2R6NGT5_9APHY|nr:hypothetical protein PHLCEN_2v12527 [Hermanssonia centrifuga]
MPVAIFSFGFFGDIITLCQLIIEFKNPLSGSQESYDEFTALVEELDLFALSVKPIERILRKVQDCSSAQHSTTTLALADFRDEISTTKAAVDACQTLLIKWKARLDRYSKQPMTTSRWRSAYRKVRWHFSSTRKDIATFRTELGSKASAIDRIFISLMLEQRICKLLSQIPPTLVVEFITFTDMLDRKMPITMENCSDRKRFHKYLLYLFGDSAGLSYVQSGDYDVTEQETEEGVADRWDMIVKPGSSLVMSALLRRVVPFPDLQRRECPTCERVNDIQTQSRKSTTCQYCNTTFKHSKSDAKLSTPVDDSDNHPRHQTSSSTSSSRSPTNHASASDRRDGNDSRAEDTQFIRRFVVIQRMATVACQHKQIIPQGRYTVRGQRGQPSLRIDYFSSDGRKGVPLSRSTYLLYAHEGIIFNHRSGSLREMSCLILFPGGYDPYYEQKNVVFRNNGHSFDRLLTRAKLAEHITVATEKFIRVRYRDHHTLIDRRLTMSSPS